MEKNNYFEEILGFLLLSVGCFLFLSLVSFCPHDYAQDVYPTHKFVHNVCGTTGAALSRTMFWWLGQGASFFLTLVFIFWGGYLFLQDWREVSPAGLGLFLLTLSLMEVELGMFRLHPTLPPGGRYGIFFGAFLKDHFHSILRYLFILFLFGLSWYWIVETWMGEREWEEDQEDKEKEAEKALHERETEKIETSPLFDLPPRTLLNPNLYSSSLRTTLHEVLETPHPTPQYRAKIGLRQKDQQPLYLNLRRDGGLLLAGGNGGEVVSALKDILLSLLYQKEKEEMKLILLDSQGNLKNFESIPHLTSPVIKDWNRLGALMEWMREEIQRRKESLKDKKEGLLGTKKMPWIILAFEELGDVMLSAPKEVEDFLGRLAQEGSEVGVFCLAATRRPSLDVITPAIKSLCRARLALKVYSRIDSNLIIGCEGAEKISHRGQGLFFSPELTHATSILLPQTTGGEVVKTVRYLRSFSQPHYEIDFGSTGLEKAG